MKKQIGICALITMLVLVAKSGPCKIFCVNGKQI